MTRFAACLLAFLLSWPTWAAEKMVLELECHDSRLVKDAMRAGQLMPKEVGINADGDMVVLFAVAGGGYWMGLVTNNGETVCGLSAGPSWEIMGQAS